MRILRLPTDFRVVEQFDDRMLARQGGHLVYSVSKKGMTTAEAVARIAEAAGVERDAVVAAAQKPREGVAGQVVSVDGGEPVQLRSPELTVRRLGVAERPVDASDILANAFEVVVRDLRGDDMRRLRHNLAQVREFGLPNYFDDQRFGCLRHGQGYVVRELLRGRAEQALKALLAAPSPYGHEAVENYKAGLRKRWGDWRGLLSFCNGRRGKSAFQHLVEQPDDFEGALRVGVSTRERTMHLFAYQSHLWNRALALWVRQVCTGEELGWMPCDEGSLPVWRRLEPDARAVFAEATLPLPGPGLEADEDAMRWYRPVFEAERVTPAQFAALDVPGFRPTLEQRPVAMHPEYLRAAPAQLDELYRRSRKMRVRFTLPRNHYATLVLKRLLMPTEAGAGRMVMWVSRHPLVWPADDGTPQAFEFRSREAGDEERRGERRDDRGRRDDRDRRGDRRDDRGRGGDRREDRGRREDGRGGGPRGGRGPWRGGSDERRRGGGDDRDRDRGRPRPDRDRPRPDRKPPQRAWDEGKPASDFREEPSGGDDPWRRARKRKDDDGDGSGERP